MQPYYELSKKLADILRTDEAKDYAARNILIYEALPIALHAGLKAGIRIDLNEPDWPVIYIELPTGQITYHVEPHPISWDGHTTPEKIARVRSFIEAIQR